MNREDILNLINNSNSLKDCKSHFTLLGEGALVLAGIIENCDYIEISFNEEYLNSMNLACSTYINEEDYKLLEENVYLCTKNSTVYRVEKTRYGFFAQTIPAAVTYLRDKVGYFRYKLLFKKSISEEDKMSLKNMLNVLKVTIPAYTKYKQELRKNNK